MSFSIRQCNLLGGVLAVGINVLIIAIFAARLAGRSRLEYGIGVLLILLILPLAYLLVSAFYLPRPGIYFLWIALMILFLAVELFLDYVLQVPFRQVRWQTIAYVMLFFASTGGMLGVASLAGRGWAAAATGSWLVMGILAFVQRGITGL